MIQKCTSGDFPQIWSIINDSAAAYKGVIPADRWKEPYMPEAELKAQMAEGVEFWGYREGAELKGVMGIQYKGDVTLIRHAYVRSAYRKEGIGSQLLQHLATIAQTPVLIGTWAAAGWAISFYRKHGFEPVPEAEKERLLRTYWSIPERQVETSVVLAGRDWKGLQA
ncbi:MAG TPA: GNAT family N-acetyltransferase [Chitinophagaceae bacterium]|jgi:GNAT superfamily N-acetyltransferase|nr:GNAT family N-acetyltransferase [Chitinophagaceae bacterium]